MSRSTAIVIATMVALVIVEAIIFVPLTQQVFAPILSLSIAAAVTASHAKLGPGIWASSALAGLVSVIGHALAGQVLGSSLLIGLISAAQAWVLLSLLPPFGPHDRPSPTILHMALTSAVVSLVGGTFKSGIVSFGNFTTFLEVAPIFAAGDFLGCVIALPIAATVVDARRRREGHVRMVRVLLTTIIPAAAVSGLVFSLGSNPFLFLLMPCGVFAAFRAGFLGASASTITIATIAAIATFGGHGPIAIRYAEPGTRLLFLQGLIIVVALVALPVATLLDQRRHAYRTAIKTRDELRLVTDNATDMICRIGLDGVRRYVSPASRKLLGFAPEELVGKTPMAVIHPEDRARVEATCRSLLDGAEQPICTYRQQHRDGHYVWVEASYQLVTRDGVPVEFIAAVRDVTRRREAEQAALASQERIEERERVLAMAEATAKIGHWHLDSSSGKLFWSDEVFRIHGRSDGTPPPLDDAINCYHPDDRAMVSDQVAIALGGGEGFVFEARIVRPGGEVRWVASRGQAEKAPNGEVVGLFGVFQDVTARVESLQAMERARGEAEEALASRRLFTATMIHEIRTPLTSILASTALLRDAGDERDRARTLDIIERSGRLLGGLVDDVLIFSRLEGGDIEIEARPFDLEECIRDVIALLTPDAEAKGLLLNFEAPGRLGSVIGDQTRLSRVLMNLLSNAVKFTRAGAVRLNVARLAGGRWRFEVVDTGTGISADRLQSIFDPFVQADPSVTRRYGGTGLGLSICRMMVRAMGGEITVNSKVGSGSRFTFEIDLPIVVDSAAVDNREEADGDMHVLIAEDNDTNRYLIAELVRRLGHRVTVAENGLRAVDLFCEAATSFDLILMDVQMPIMDGLMAARAIRESAGGGAIPIYALTADVTAPRRLMVDAAGMTGVLAKPVEMEALIAVLAARAPIQRDLIFDPARLQSLTTTLGIGGRATLLKLMLGEIKSTPRRIRELIDTGQNEIAGQEAHSLRGAASSVGALPLVEILHRIEAGARAGRIEPSLLDELDDMAARLTAAATDLVAEAA
ncbi:hypothetical protein COC42_12130 [Sphingomonas spermidinifaciens]|uniref:histidine kinase n=2 Tax=Sphingomonas spermidinifaciens TaxID=1141889 RepID=A0A2A4AZ33_9SPHN|nr:hypothetical protein COC42_12130 [Sphingomonas spermidinifaciens]